MTILQAYYFAKERGLPFKIVVGGGLFPAKLYSKFMGMSFLVAFGSEVNIQNLMCQTAS